MLTISLTRGVTFVAFKFSTINLSTSFGPLLVGLFRAAKSNPSSPDDESVEEDKMSVSTSLGGLRNLPGVESRFLRRCVLGGR